MTGKTPEGIGTVGGRPAECSAGNCVARVDSETERDNPDELGGSNGADVECETETDCPGASTDN